MSTSTSRLTDGVLKIGTALLFEKDRFVFVEFLPESTRHPTRHDQVQKSIGRYETEDPIGHALTNIEQHQTAFVLG